MRTLSAKANVIDQSSRVIQRQDACFRQVLSARNAILMYPFLFHPHGETLPDEIVPANNNRPLRIMAGFFKPGGIYYGWRVAVVAFLSAGFSIGMTHYAFGVFAEPLETEFGWSRTQLNAGLAVGVLTAASAPIAGRFMDLYGARPVMVVSLLFVAFGYIFRPLIHDLWHWYALNALVFIGFPGATVLPAGRLAGNWFPNAKGRMIGVITAGNNFGGLTMVPFATLLITLAGWRWTYFAFGVLLLALAGLAIVIVRDRPSDVYRARSEHRNREPPADSPTTAITGFELSEVLRLPGFYLVTIAITAASFTYSAVLTQLIPHLRSQGISEGGAAAALTLVGAMGIVSKIVFGRLSETITARVAMIISVALQSAGLALLIASDSNAVQWIGIVVFATGFGGFGALIVLTISESFGLKAFGSVMGLVQTASAFPMVVGPITVGVLFDRTGDYRLGFSIILVFFGLAIAMLIASRQRPYHPNRGGSKRANNKH